MESLVQLIGIDHLLHFLFCFFVVVVLTALNGKKNIWVVMLMAFGLAAFKEVYDMYANIYHMTTSALVCDSLWDMAGNIFGLVAAVICLERMK